MNPKNRLVRDKLRSIPSKAEFLQLLDHVTLDENARSLLEFHYLKNRGLGWIGDTLGYSEATIKRKHRETLARLGRYFDDTL